MCSDVSQEHRKLGLSNTISDDLVTLQVNRTQEKPCVLRKMFCKLDIRRKSIVTLALS